MRNSVVIWIAARNIKRSYSTYLTKLILGYMRTERIRRQIILALYTFHLISWNDEVEILTHHTNRTVTYPYIHLVLSFDFKAYCLTMTATFIKF
jgi:hypothetical protein